MIFLEQYPLFENPVMRDILWLVTSERQKPAQAAQQCAGLSSQRSGTVGELAV